MGDSFPVPRARRRGRWRCSVSHASPSSSAWSAV